MDKPTCILSSNEKSIFVNAAQVYKYTKHFVKFQEEGIKQRNLITAYRHVRIMIQHCA